MPKYLAILGGGLHHDAEGWRTCTFAEGDNFGPTGDFLRVLAAVFLFERDPDMYVVAVGGKGQYAQTPGAPTVASVLTDELRAAGIPQEQIVLEERSGNTYQQLLALAQLAEQSDTTIQIISNNWHLPRIQAMLAHAPALQKSTLRDAQLVSAEDVVIQFDAGWKEKIEQVLRSPAMAKRLAIERQGVEQIKAGTYSFV